MHNNSNKETKINTIHNQQSTLITDYTLLTTSAAYQSSLNMTNSNLGMSLTYFESRFVKY